MAASRVTGLTGLKPSKNPHMHLKVLYDKILRSLNGIPQEAAYRKHTTAIVNERLHIINSSKDIDVVEEKINGGKIEEVILQAERELSLSRKMQKWKPWEPLIEEPPKDQWKWPF